LKMKLYRCENCGGFYGRAKEAWKCSDKHGVTIRTVTTMEVKVLYKKTFNRIRPYASPKEKEER